MHCPFCENELIKGTFRSRGANYFLPDGEKIPKLYTAKSMAKSNAITIPPDILDISTTIDWPIAYACPDCKKIIIEY